MPSLLDTLESSFSSGGFGLQTVLSELGTAATGVAPSGVAMDPTTLARIGQQLGGVSLGAITPALAGVTGRAGALLTSFPHGASVLGPLSDALHAASTFAGADPHAALALFERVAGAGTGGPGMAGLAGPLAALASARSQEPLAAVLGVLGAGLPGGLRLDGTIATLGGHAEGVAALVQLTGALMSSEALTRELTGTAQTIGGMLDAAAADAALAQLTAAGTAQLATLISATAPDDPDQVAAVVPVVTQFADAIRAAGDRLVHGLAFGEVTLVGAGVDTLTRGINQASQLLTEASLDPVRRLAAEIALRIEPLLRLDLGAPAASVDAFLAELTGQLTALAATIDRIDPAAIARPISTGLGSALAPLRQLETVAASVNAALRSALQTAQQAIAALDLRPVVQAIQSALQPALVALHDLEQLIGGAQTELATLAGDVTSALTAVRHSFDTAAGAIHDALGRVATTVQGLHLEQLEQTLKQDLAATAHLLAGAQVEPYFTTATHALQTAQSTVAAVPLSILPDDLRQQLDDAVAPIKTFDFDGEVRQPLESQLDAILSSLQSDVLDAVQQAYQQVVTFIASIDPRPPLTHFEHDAFDPMLARVRTVDPTTLLAPVQTVIEEVKAAVAGLDLRRDVLAPLESAFDQLANAFDALDPAALLAPLETEVGQLRDQIAHRLDIPQLRTWLAQIDPAVTRILGRLDVAAVVALLDAAWSQLGPAPEPTGASALATVVAGLLEGTGLTVRMDSFGAVTRWIAGTDPSAEITARITEAVAAIDGAVAVVERVDPQAVVAAVQPAYTSTAAAVAALPDGSLLKTRLVPVLAGASPLELLGAAVDNRNRYLASLRTLQIELHRLAASARSELTAIARGLREAFAPLGAIQARLRALLGRIGLPVRPTQSLRELVAELFALVTPSRILAPLEPAVGALMTKLAALAHDVLVVPVGQALDTIEAALAALDISFIRSGLQTIHDQIAADIQQLRPSVVLADVLTTVDHAKATIAGFDPLAPVRTAIDAMKAAIDDVAAHYRPTVLFAPVLALHAEIVTALGTLDVRTVLQPILTALDDIKAQLDHGLDGTSAALTGLQRALP